MSELSAWEIIECGRYNLEENLPRLIPTVKNNPIYLMGIEQLNKGLRKLGEEKMIKRKASP